MADFSCVKCQVLFGNYNRALIFIMYIPSGKKFLNLSKYSYWRKMVDLSNSSSKTLIVCLVVVESRCSSLCLTRKYPV